MTSDVSQPERRGAPVRRIPVVVVELAEGFLEIAGLARAVVKELRRAEVPLESFARQTGVLIDQPAPDTPDEGERDATTLLLEHARGAGGLAEWARRQGLKNPI